MHRRAIVLSLVLGVAAVSQAAPAVASTISTDGTTVFVTGGAGERNELVVGVNPESGSSNLYFANDTGAALTPGRNCEQGTYAVQCQLGGPANVVVDAGDGDDTVDLQVPGSVAGGLGNDQLRGVPTGGLQSFDGGPGNDVLVGDKTGYCTAGHAGRGPDVLNGGDGVDTVDYSQEDVASVTASIDGVANDGAPGEGDNIGVDIENLTGSSCGPNDLTGSAGPNAISGPGVLRGLAGDDVLFASGGDDTLDGGDGNDKLTGRSGNDKLDGGAGDDFLEGGFDDDVLTGGPGKDSLVGDETASNTIGTGNDLINADDGVGETISCGPGADVANVDALDQVPVDTQNLCETVNRSGGTVPPAGGGGVPTPTPTPVSARELSASKLSLDSRSRTLRVKFTCRTTRASGCNGVVRVSLSPKGGKSVRLASKTVSLARGKSKTYTLKLGTKARSKVVRRQTLRLKVSASLRTDAGVKRSSQTITIRRRVARRR